MAAYYPIFVEMQSAFCLVIGGGKVAERKIAGLVSAGAGRIVVVSPRISARIRQWVNERKVEHVKREATTRDLARLDEHPGARLVFLCTNSPALQRSLSKTCHKRSLLVNVADSPEESLFLAASVVQRGAVQVAISSGAESPSLAAHLKREIDQYLDPAYAIFAKLLGEMRRRDMAKGVSLAERRRRFNELIEGGVIESITQGGEEAGRARILQLLGRGSV